MKKILFSLTGIVAVAALVVAGTGAFFSDTETSTGNVFTAGAIDLKVDHTRQTYNGVDCKTCDVTLISDTSNMVVAKNNVPETPYPAKYLTWIHPAWTAQDDPTLLAAGAQWIWESDPVKQEDTTADAQYTFRKQFNWMGPIIGSDLWFAVGSDNSVEVWLNGVKVGENTGEYGYRQESMLHIPGAAITSNIVQGNNVLEFKVKNWGLENGSPSSNPAGLIYKFQIDGNCGDDYFKTHCTLFGEKDLTPADHFWMFDDIKPGDSGTNLISLHPDSNDAHICLFAHGLVDEENTLLSLETAAGDPGMPTGELSSFLKMFAWKDDGDGIYEPGPAEPVIAGPDASLATGYAQLAVAGNATGYVGIAWCAGAQGAPGNPLACSGSGMGNIAQTDKTMLDMTAYAVQQRNNAGFSCEGVVAGYRPADK